MVAAGLVFCGLLVGIVVLLGVLIGWVCFVVAAGFRSCGFGAIQSFGFLGFDVC